MKSFIQILICYILTQGCCYAQDVITLDRAVKIAQESSIDFFIAKNDSDVSYWAFESFKSQFMPSLNINGTLPNYVRSINRITADDGTDIFISQNQAFSSLALNVDQNIALTGGRISVSSVLNRIDVFSDNNATTFSAIPLSINYFQESIFYNSFRWEKKIEPLLFEESRRQLLEDLEDIAMVTAARFFDYAIAQRKYENALINEASQDSIYQISEGRFKIGKLFENDVLQAELSLLNSRQEVIVTQNEQKLAKQSLLQQLGYTSEKDIALILPEDLLFIKIDSATLFNKALENRKLMLEQRRRILEAEQEVAKTKSDDVKIGITGNLGFTQQSNAFSDVYSDLLVQQNFALNLAVPLYTWGRRKAEKKIALANLELVKSNNEQERMEAMRELELKYLQWQQLKNSVTLARKASEISVKRFRVSKRRFAIGKTSITDLNIAQSEKDLAVIGYYEALQAYWELFYELRKLTLYDFQKERDIRLESFR